MSERESVVEAALEVFSRLERELDNLDEEAAVKRGELLELAARKSSEIYEKIVSIAGEKATKLLEDVKRATEAESEKLVSSGKAKSKELVEKFDQVKEEIIKRIVEMLLP